ncbi:MAG: hypothetical protein ACREDF_10175 [Thermoplasmata archaeon]
MNRRLWYEMLATGALAIAGVAVVLAAAGAALQQALSAGAASLCAVLFFVPGVYFFGYSRRLRARDLVLVHAAAFAKGRDAIRIQDLAEELRVPREDAERILRIAVQEGHLRGRFEAPDRFVAQRPETRSPDGTRGRSGRSSPSRCRPARPSMRSRRIFGGRVLR